MTGGTIHHEEISGHFEHRLGPAVPRTSDSSIRARHIHHPPRPDLERRGHALDLLRTINTAEIGERSNYGSYEPWQTLLAHQPKFFDKFLAISYPQVANLHFADMPEILPGWSLRFNVPADGHGYDVRLQDLTDKQWGYVALTDESDVI